MDELTPDSAETRRLLRQLRTGDRRVFDRLFARHRPYLCRLVEMRIDPRLRPRVDPSDVVQEAQLDAFKRLDDYLARSPMPFRLWLRKTAHERLLKIRDQHVHAARRAVTREEPLPEPSSRRLADVLIAADSNPSQKAARRELARQVRQVLATMGDSDREILLMRNLEGLSYLEVGRILGIEPPTARKRHARALVRFHQALREAGLRESQL